MYLDANGIDHASYTAACRYYGADDAETLAGEAEYFEALYRDHERTHNHGFAMVDDAREAGLVAAWTDADPVAFGPVAPAFADEFPF